MLNTTSQVGAMAFFFKIVFFVPLPKKFISHFLTCSSYKRGEGKSRVVLPQTPQSLFLGAIVMNFKTVLLPNFVLSIFSHPFRTKKGGEVTQTRVDGLNQVLMPEL